MSRAGTRRPRFAHAHEQVAQTAEELCLNTYEVLMGNNQVREAWKAQHPGFSEKHLQLAFLKRYKFHHIAAARAALATILSGPYDDAFKDKVLEALCLDNTLVRGRARPLGGPGDGVQKGELNNAQG